MRACAKWVGGILLGLFVLGSPLGARGAAVLDRILVVVNGQPITQSRVALFKAFLLASGGRGLGWPRETRDVFALTQEEVLEIVLVDELLFESASRANVVSVREQAVEARIEAFKGHFGTERAYDGFVRRYGWNYDAQREFFSRRLRVEGYIRFKLGAGPPDAEAQRAFYRSHQARYGEKSFDEVRAEVATALFADRFGKDFDRWVAELRERALVSVPTRQIVQ